MDYSYGGGSIDGHFYSTDKHSDGSVSRNPVSPGEWAVYLQENECDYVYIDVADDEFVEVYGYLFSDALRGYREGTADLYRVTESGGTILLIPA